MKKLLLSFLLLLASVYVASAQQTVVICSYNAIGQCVSTQYGSAGYPPGAVPVQINATATTGGIATGLPSAANKYTYLCGIAVSPGSAATAITISVTITNIGATSMVWWVGAPVTAVGVTGATFTQTFNPCLPANAVNTGPGLAVGALSTSGVNQTASMWGYEQ